MIALDPQQALREYKFYHIIRLTDSLTTPGNPKFVPQQQLVLRNMRRLPIAGKRVLDIGCRDGLFSFEAENRGAAEVIGIDNDLSRPAVEFLIPFFQSKVRMHELNVLDLQPETFGRFDVILFAGVLYHLRYPVWSLRLIRNVLAPGGRLILETAIWRGRSRHAMLYCPIGEENPYDPTSCTFFNEKGLCDTLKSLGLSVDSIEYLQSGFKSRAGQIKNFLSRKLRGVASITNIERAVFVCSLAGAGGEVTDYWEGTHDIHARIGGGQIENRRRG